MISGFTPSDFGNSRRPATAHAPVLEWRFPQTFSSMENLVFYLIVQFNLIFGVAGLMWPDKLMPVFGLLMFPWPASHRAIRIHGIVAVAGYLLVLTEVLARAHN